jgi:hypothetical protein
MPNVTIYLPEALAERIKSAQLSKSVSSFCRIVIQNALDLANNLDAADRTTAARREDQRITVSMKIMKAKKRGDRHAAG